MDIKRYDVLAVVPVDVEAEESADGDWVKFEDHEAALAALSCAKTPVGCVVEQTENDTTVCRGVLFATYIGSDSYKPGALLYAAPPAHHTQAVDLGENMLSVLIEEGMLSRNGRVFQKLRALIDSQA